ncbi:MAG: hypothetical protein DMG06_06120 [Acidobacteria bacterium]|nr:MAG: hypothetical protein DMG06_06120 [Acidobacteriota bacterium]
MILSVSPARLASFGTLLRIQHDQAYTSDLLHRRLTCNICKSLDWKMLVSISSPGDPLSIPPVLEGEGNENAVSTFLRRHPEFILDLPADANLRRFFDEQRHFRLFPPVFPSDGFFAALLRKASDCR